MRDFVKQVTADRVSGERPSPPRAVGAAAIVGTASALITYKLLRR